MLWFKFNNIKCIKTWNESCRKNLELSFIHMLAWCHSKENTDHRVVFQHLEDHYYIVHYYRDYDHQTWTTYTLLERMLGVTPPKEVVTSLARRALILTNTHIFTFGGATITKCRLQVHLLEKSLEVTFWRHNHAVTWLTNKDSSILEEAYCNNPVNKLYDF